MAGLLQVTESQREKNWNQKFLPKLRKVFHADIAKEYSTQQILAFEVLVSSLRLYLFYVSVLFSPLLLIIKEGRSSLLAT